METRSVRLIVAACGAAALVVACNAAGRMPLASAPRSAARSHVGMHVRFAYHRPPSAGRRTFATGTNVVGDPGFESGGFGVWQQCGNGYGVIDSSNPHSGSYDALVGNLASNPGEESGFDGVCQTVTVPANGQLSVWVDEGTSERSTQVADQEADLLDASGTIIATLYAENGNTNGYVEKTFDLSSYGGQTVTLFFGIYGSGSSNDYNFVYVDDVSLAGGSSGPTPQPSPTGGPTPTPQPSAAPGGGPTPFPTPPGSGPQGTSCGTSCGVQRWHIKTLDDADESLISWTPIATTVSALRGLAVPSNYDQYNDTSRYAPVEEQVYTVQAILVGWKIENDHDFHLVLADPNDPSATMIAEPPDPACSDACDSGFSQVFSSVRAKLTNCFGQPPTTFTNFSQTIVANFTGVGFFDVVHGQTGVAPNGIELHPLLDVQFVSGAPGC
jgi:hypothetical protein